MDYSTEIVHKLIVPANTGKYTLQDIMIWLEENNIEVDMQFLSKNQHGNYGYKKVISYSFIFKNEDDVISFKMRWV